MTARAVSVAHCAVVMSAELPVLMQNEEIRTTEDCFGGSEQSDWLRNLNRLVLDVYLYRC